MGPSGVLPGPAFDLRPQPAHEDLSTLPWPGWERWPGHPPTGPLSSLLRRPALRCSRRGCPREIILWKAGRERVGVQAPTVLPRKVTLQAELAAEAADAPGADLCTSHTKGMLMGTLHIAPTLLGPILSPSSLLSSLLCSAWSLCYPISHVVWDQTSPHLPLMC